MPNKGLENAPPLAAGSVPSAPPMRTICTVMLSGPPRRFANCTRKRHASSGGSMLATAPISVSCTGPLNPSANHKDIAWLHRMRSFDIHLHQSVGAERADNDVALEAVQFFRLHVLPAGHFP